jgi:FixJ family two-component response regulator
MPRQKKSVVVVEDDTSMSQAIERLLRTASFQPVMFGSAEALLETNAVATAGCLVLDVRLPGLSGFELHQRLTAQGDLPPVIFITAHDTPTARQQARVRGKYLLKPFPGRELVDAIKSATEAKARSGVEPHEFD